MPKRVTITDPLERFKAIYAALERDRRWWKNSARLRYGAMAAIACKGDAGEVAGGIRSIGKALGEEFPWHWGVGSQVQFIVAASLLQHGDSAKAFVKELIRVRKLLRREKLHRGLQYELIAVLMLRIQAKGKAISESTVRRFAAVYAEMKRHHRFLTGPDDFPGCAILAGRTGTPQKILEDVEAIYLEMRSHKFAGGNWLQASANIMQLADDSARGLARRASALRDEFKKRKVRISERDYADIAMLSMLGLPARGVVARVEQLREQLRAVRPKMDRATTFDLAVGLAFLYLATPTVTSASLAVKTMVDVHAMIAAQQAALMAAAAAASAASVAASS